MFSGSMLLKVIFMYMLEAQINKKFLWMKVIIFSS